MKLFKEIFARIWALWSILTFVVTFLIIFLPSMATYLIPGKKGHAIFILLGKIWMRVWMFLIACPLTVKGKENFKKGQAYIVTCNHNSFMDVPISCPFIPGPNKTIAKTSFTRIPLFGWYYAKGSVLVDRSKKESRLKSFAEMKQTLKEGMHMSIYPEGTRNRTNEPIKPFYNGAFKLAVETKNPIIPAILLHTKKVLPINKKFYLWPHKLEIHFLEPIHITNQSADQLKNYVFEVMKAYYIQHQ
jgi:1-acyl-sn-glycerol-3-phosphate acyltransferase